MDLFKSGFKKFEKILRDVEKAFVFVRACQSCLGVRFERIAVKEIRVLCKGTQCDIPWNGHTLPWSKDAAYIEENNVVLIRAANDGLKIVFNFVPNFVVHKPCFGIDIGIFFDLTLR